MVGAEIHHRNSHDKLQPEIKVVLLFFTMMKLLFFLRVYEEFTLLVIIIKMCFIDIVPFIVSYISFLTVFTLVF